MLKKHIRKRSTPLWSGTNFLNVHEDTFRRLNRKDTHYIHNIFYIPRPLYYGKAMKHFQNVTKFDQLEELLISESTVLKT